MNSKYLIHVLILLLIGGNAFCKTIKVPEDKPNLRAAIKKAKSGDVVLVSPGIYRGPDNKNLVIKKKGITVRSVEGPFNTIIDGEGTGRCFDVRPMKLGKEEVYDRITITGFTIRNFSVDSTEGGAAVRCQSYIWLQNCIITNNNAGTGGSIFLSGKESSILLYGNTIVENKGGGVYIDPTSIRPNEISLSIFWGNSPCELYSEKKEYISVCNIKGGGSYFQHAWTSPGCFEDDPLFADPENGNYRLTSCSPCIDASTHNDPRDGTLRDVGVYSLPYAPCNPADLLRLYAGIDLQTGDSITAEQHYAIGAIYYLGKGVPQNHYEAATWFQKAAKQGDLTAQMQLGFMYFDGEGVPQNYTEAADWFRKVAEQGSAEAQFYLGWMYSNEKGVLQSDSQAVYWYRKAAEQGFVDAQNNLGVMYAAGEGVLQSDTEAVNWFRKAAEQGHQKAQYSLGKAYADGRGVTQSDSDAALWYKKAADQGHAKAKNQLELIHAKTVSPANVNSFKVANKKYQPSNDIVGLIQANDGVYSSYFKISQRLATAEYLVTIPSTNYLFHCTIPSYVKMKGFASGTTFMAVVKAKGEHDYVTVQGSTNTVKKITVLYGEKVGY